MRDFVFVDCETTGLNPKEDDLVELTYALDNSEPTTLYFGVKKVPAFIDGLIKFTERGLADKPAATPEDIEAFKEVMRNNTLVAANASFDRDFLLNNDMWTGHYRLLEIESYAMAKLGMVHVPSMKEIYDELSERGYDLVTPDHTALNDMLALRQAYYILRWM
jgi:DNA polymerase III epsilon subunit-like protein